MENPNDPKHRPFLLPGDYPPPATPDEFGFVDDPMREDQAEREHALKYESGPMYGEHPVYPDRGMPMSPEMVEAEEKRQEYLRACHGGLPDSSPGNPAIAVLGGTPFTNLKG